MPRRKPASAKQKKAQLQEKRAVKRGDPPLLTPGGTAPSSSNLDLGPSKKTYIPPSKTHLSRSALLREPASAVHARQTSRALTSTFGRVDRGFVERAKRRAEGEVLGRPVGGGVARWRGPIAPCHRAEGEEQQDDRRKQDENRQAALAALSARLTIPRRPKWKRRPGAEGITKKELERNELGAFRRWEEEMRGVMREWEELVEGRASVEELGDGGGEAGPSSRPLGVSSGTATPPPSSTSSDQPASALIPPLHVPTTFETNLEVYRQLWRVAERSDVILALADVRCPPVGFSDAMRGWLREVVYGKAREDWGGKRRVKIADAGPTEQESGKRSRGTPTPTSTSTSGRRSPTETGKRVVLVLTKTDLVDARCRDGWVRWCKAWWRGGREDAEGDENEVDVVCVESYDTEALNAGPRHQHKHIPHIPPTSLAQLVGALERAHTQLVDAGAASVRRRVAWERLLRGEAIDQEDTKLHDSPQHEEEVAGGEAQAEPDYITIGLIGQPNVGKSSLLNALVGQTKVKASKTPGKTKHFQTIFWNEEVRIVDCPGLVVPALVGFDMQVMAGVLQISQIPSLPACISHVARLMPLEEILRIPPPAKWAEDALLQHQVESKKTYRKVEGQGDGPAPDGQPAVRDEQVKEILGGWTPYLIMEGWALDRGFLTAKAGRPDVNRAGNAIMRMVAEGRIPWAFWAPDTPDEDLQPQQRRGVWTGGTVAEEPLEPHATEEDHEDESELETEVETEVTASSSEEVSDNAPVAATSRFAALEVNDAASQDDGDDTPSTDSDT